MKPVTSYIHLLYPVITWNDIFKGDKYLNNTIVKWTCKHSLFTCLVPVLPTALSVGMCLLLACLLSGGTGGAPKQVETCYEFSGLAWLGWTKALRWNAAMIRSKPKRDKTNQLRPHRHRLKFEHSSEVWMQLTINCVWNVWNMFYNWGQQWAQLEALAAIDFHEIWLFHCFEWSWHILTHTHTNPEHFVETFWFGRRLVLASVA